MKTSRNNGQWLAVMAAIAVVAMLCSCGTVTPTQVRAPVASFDGGVQNSGILSIDSVTHAATITQHAKDRYNALIEKYGSRFPVPVKQDDGITNVFVLTSLPPGAGSIYLLDAEHTVKFGIMNQWAKQEKAKP